MTDTDAAADFATVLDRALNPPAAETREPEPEILSGLEPDASGVIAPALSAHAGLDAARTFEAFMGGQLGLPDLIHPEQYRKHFTANNHQGA